mgnify:CR=1 FL=1
MSPMKDLPNGPVIKPANLSTNCDRPAISLAERWEKKAKGNLMHFVISRLFKAIDKRAFIAQPDGLAVTPRFNNWKPLNAQALVVGEINIEPNGALRASFRLWDVLAEQQMVGLAYFTIPDNWRRVAHIIANNSCTGTWV